MYLIYVVLGARLIIFEEQMKLFFNYILLIILGCALKNKATRDPIETRPSKDVSLSHAEVTFLKELLEKYCEEGASGWVEEDLTKAIDACITTSECSQDSCNRDEAAIMIRRATEKEQ